jgi:Spy/CpxP family protein refolding chaperone
MLTRVHLPLALIILAGCACTRAQTPKPKPVQPAPKELKLPAIVPNVKWTVNQNSAQLLLNPEVQKDMGLPTDTKAGVLKVYSAYDAKYTALTSGKSEGSDALVARLDAAMVEAADNAIALLSPAESARLSQLGVQSMGLDALRMPEVRKGLSLTPDQTAQLDKLFAGVDEKREALDAELGARLSKLADPGPKATDEETAAFKKAVEAAAKDLDPQHEALESLKKSGWDALMASLTPEQKSAWHSIRGKPVLGT